MIKMIIAVNYHGKFFWFKQTQLVVYKFDTSCNYIQREPISLFPIWRRQGFPIVKVPMAINPKFLDLEKFLFMASQCHGKQSELDLFKKCYSYEDYANLFLLDYLEPLWILNISIAKACKFLRFIKTELSLCREQL